MYGAVLSILGQGLKCACALLFWGSSPWSTQLFPPFAPSSCSCSNGRFPVTAPPGRETRQSLACRQISSLRAEHRSTCRTPWAWHLGPAWTAQLSKLVTYKSQSIGGGGCREGSSIWQLASTGIWEPISELLEAHTGLVSILA